MQLMSMGVVERHCAALAAAQQQLESAICSLQQACESMRLAGGEFGEYALQPLHFKFQYGIPSGQALEEVKQLISKKMTTAAWEHLTSKIQMKALMNNSQFLQFQSDMRSSPPPLTPDAVRSTLEELVNHRHDIAMDGLIETFEALKLSYRSHSKWGFNKRTIIEDVLSVDFMGQMSVSDYTAGARHLRDLDRGLHYALTGAPFIELDRDIVGRLAKHIAESDEPMVMECEYFTLRMFKKGSVHVVFDHLQVLDCVNAICAKHYGAALPS